MSDMSHPVQIYDTTLRDGAQMEDISFSQEEKLLVLGRLDDLGIQYVEGGWPGSNPKDMAFFREAKKLRFRTHLVPFGATRRRGRSAKKDFNLKAILETEEPVVAIVGNTWEAYARSALRVSPDTNLRMIEETVSFLHDRGREVFFDAEHFFEGLQEQKDYALKSLRVAWEAGASCLVLCDTNGGCLPHQIDEAVSEVNDTMGSCMLGIHCHNDSGCAVANTLVAARAGVRILQGTMNGYGERSGNADLCAVIAGVETKLGFSCIGPDHLKKLKETSHYVDELLNMVPNPRQPYVGMSAFAHKAGVHVSAVSRSSRLYEHVEPDRVGNQRRFVMSELAGKSNLSMKAKEFGIREDALSVITPQVLGAVKQLELEGYQFEGADASLELMIKKAMGQRRSCFELKGFRVIVEKREDDSILSEATIKVKVDGREMHTAADGEGPVNALDNALRKALGAFYPSLAEMHLADFKVRVIDAKLGTKAKVRVIIESSDQKDTWSTVGVSHNILEASWQALVDGVEYKILREEKKADE